ncbi:hypothetical protein CAE01nite_10710 [Cellulomonas aerilata]|uniref:Threonine/serine exporter-like N-terminal domain-containing protein n=2 Tax=Cellulomonas aerilata TaxID=515326 RepID=A0A512DA48_9CELL|nr:hypothetical protein CAE01nite_10710 [Cellulomonas aerilata]
MVLAAVLVLVLTTLGVLLVQRQARRARRAEASEQRGTAGTAGTTSVPTVPTRSVEGPAAADDVAGPTGAAARSDAELVAFLLALGGAMLDAGAPVVQVQDSLRRVAAVNGASAAETVILPTALVISSSQDGTTHTAAAGAGSRALRIDQVHGVLEVAEQAQRRQLTPNDGRARLAELLEVEPPYRPASRLVGYVGLAAGLALVLGGSFVDVLLAGALGAGVAAVQVGAGRWASVYQSLVVLGCAFGVACAALLLSRTGLQTSARVAMIAPLVTFLPGALLTTGAIDLATRHMVAGAARLAGGGMQLLLLALGITGAANLVGVPSAVLAGASGGQPQLVWPWVGVLLYGLGVCLHHCVRREAVGWILLVLLVAYAGQVVGGVFFGGAVSAFVGALAMTPVAMFAAARPAGPPMLVAILPAFWLLVPGALSLVGLTTVAGGQVQGLGTVVTAAATMVAISVGVLSGLAIGSGLGTTSDRLRALVGRRGVG